MLEIVRVARSPKYIIYTFTNARLDFSTFVRYICVVERGACRRLRGTFRASGCQFNDLREKEDKEMMSKISKNFAKRQFCTRRLHSQRRRTNRKQSRSAAG